MMLEITETAAEIVFAETGHMNLNERLRFTAGPSGHLDISLSRPALDDQSVEISLGGITLAPEEVAVLREWLNRIPGR